MSHTTDHICGVATAVSAGGCGVRLEAVVVAAGSRGLGAAVEEAGAAGGADELRLVRRRHLSEG